MEIKVIPKVEEKYRSKLDKIIIVGSLSRKEYWEKRNSLNLEMEKAIPPEFKQRYNLRKYVIDNSVDGEGKYTRRIIFC